MGDALCDVIFGDKSPSGKLTTSMPKTTGQEPLYYNHQNTGRPVADDNEKFAKFASNCLDVSNGPLYPFGYGLSYTNFSYSNFRLSSQEAGISNEEATEWQDGKRASGIRVTGQEDFIMKTEITELLGIEYPVIQGGMAWVAECHLAAAVSNAGGLGLIAAGGAPAEWVREQIRETKKLTDKPFGVNIMLMNPESEKVAKVIVEEGVKVVTTGAGSPEKYMADWKAAGVKVIPVVASVALAKRMERCGADAVVAEGCEAGGHIGELTTMVLVPQVVDAVKIPVIAAGGIADGRGMAAAFMLGAKGIQMGTVFAASKESVIHENYKNSIIKAKDIDSRVTGRSTGHPIRVLRNDMVRRYLELEKAGAPFEELEQLTLGSLRKAVQEGDAKNGSLMAGQIAGMIKEERSCEDIIKTTVVDAGKLMNGVNADE